MAEKQLEKVTAGAPADKAYGRTPEEALMGVLALHPKLDHREAYYHGERPPFMDVKAERGFTEHDWQQYEGRRDGIRFDTMIVADAPMTPDQRVQITLSNVWLEVAFGDRRADVKFQFRIQFRESELEDDDELRAGDHHWCCERKNTEKLDD